MHYQMGSHLSLSFPSLLLVVAFPLASECVIPVLSQIHSFRLTLRISLRIDLEFPSQVGVGDYLALLCKALRIVLT